MTRLAGALLLTVCCSSPSPKTAPTPTPPASTDAPPTPTTAEAPEATAGVREYRFEPAARLPDVKGVSNYRPLDARTVRFAINVWTGWAPIIAANNGLKPGKRWTTPKGAPFEVELVLIDNPVRMRDAFAAGTIHVGWASVDMLPWLLQGLVKDSRTMPRVYQQIDWSNGGDGIVARGAIKSASDLRGKTVVVAQNSPSHYFLLHTLVAAGVQPSEVNIKFTADAFRAAAAFVTTRSMDAVVSRAPDVYRLAEPRGFRMLDTTSTANKLIADAWFARADFAKDHPDIIEGLVRGIFDGQAGLATEDGKSKAAALVASAYGTPKTETREMLNDAHSTNAAENRAFFLATNNPTSFRSTYESAQFLYKQTGDITDDTVRFDHVADFSILKRLLRESEYAEQKDNYQIVLPPPTPDSINVDGQPALIHRYTIRFTPNASQLDPNSDAPKIIEEVERRANLFGAAGIIVEGHTDLSMMGRATRELAIDLSSARASAVKRALLARSSVLQAVQITTVGRGWDSPADAGDRNNHERNRRVEIKVFKASPK